MRTPTEKQYRLLRCLGGGAALVIGRKGEVNPLARHGWVSGEWHEDEGHWSFVRITPDGLRALALAVERYGLPEILPTRIEQADA